MDKIIELYKQGETLENISELLNLNIEKLKEMLSDYKKSCRYMRNYIPEFKQLLLQRHNSGFTLQTIGEEMQMDMKIVSKYIKSIGGKVKKKGRPIKRNEYEVIEWQRFDQCPDCESKNVNEVNTIEVNNSYCMDCGTEWYKTHKKQIRKVIWEFVS